MENPGINGWQIRQMREGSVSERLDHLAVEEPLEVKIEYGPASQRKRMSLSVTMRTPGNDEELTRGFLLTEGIIRQPGDIMQIETPQVENTITLALSPDFHFVPGDYERHFYASSSCGVCGKSSIEMVKVKAPWIFTSGAPKIHSPVLQSLPEKLRQQQDIFSSTGGLHATGLFDQEGNLLQIREDIGRHNAMDKLIGWAMVNYPLPLENFILVVSGRAGFELVQKAWMAGVPIVAAVGAPSSLAAGLAKDQGMTLVGFLRKDRYNIYSGFDRIL